MIKNKKRVLLINPAKNDEFTVNRMHMGLTLLGGILALASHEVLVMDYAFLRQLKGKIKVPGIFEVINDFKPDIIGISVFTYLYDECQEMIDEISKCSNAPIILGGPHVTFFPEDFINDRRISYIVRGEAESVILDLVNDAELKAAPIIINCPIPSAQEIPAVNLDIAFGSKYLQFYQIQLSRGCPFSCSFCNIRTIAGRQVRVRKLEGCIEQILSAKDKYPDIHTIIISDDCPTFDRGRFKEFLAMFLEKRINCMIIIDNVRADLIDEEMLKLYVAAGGRNICLGVESGCPEVFKSVNKGESLEAIIAAASLVRKYKLLLGLCFVIGLPEDTLERNRYSIDLAKNLKADYVFWNMCTPWPETEVHKWFMENGQIGDVRNFSTLIDPYLSFKAPCSWTPEFNRDDRVKAWLMANLETLEPAILSLKNWNRSFKNTIKLFKLAIKYRIYRSFFIYLRGFFFHRVYLALKSRQKRINKI